MNRSKKHWICMATVCFLVFSLWACGEPEDGDDHGVVAGEGEHGKPTLYGSGWEEPAGKADAMQGRPGLPVSVDDSETAVWEVRNAWEDRDTTEARQAGLAWEEDSGLSWEEKFQVWVESMPAIDRPGHGETFLLTTPFGVEVPAPALECAELAMFLRIAFASWYGLPYFTEALDGHRQRLYFGHFGIRTAEGRYGRMANFRTQYNDYSDQAAAILAGEADWPSDPELARRSIPGSFDDAQPMIGPDANAGAYFDRVFLNKRVGYFLMMQLTYFGSVNLADPVNTFHVVPEATRPGDVLLHRWQATGIGHVMVVMRAERFGSGAAMRMEAEVASGSMPRRQPLWENPVSTRRNFTNSYAGGPGYGQFNGGLKRFRAATNIDGRWTNVVPASMAGDYLPATARQRIEERPSRYEDLLTELQPTEQLQAMAGVVEQHRAHLRSYPASCAARTRREDAFNELYLLGEELGMTREEIDETYRTTEDYVFAELVYGQSKTCCWNSTTPTMYQLAMEMNQEIIDAAGAESCPDLVVFKGRADGGDGFEVFREYAAARELGDAWVAWSADETCPQANVSQDTEVGHQWTPFCSLSLGEIVPVDPEDPETTVHHVTNDQVYPIPDNDPDGARSPVEVDVDGVVVSVAVDAEITHTWRGDLVVYLVFDGVPVEVKRGSGWEDDLILDEIVVEGFAGKQARGTWELWVVDTMAQDVGQIETWTLRLTIES